MTVKSFAVRPSIDLPFLSFAVTVSITRLCVTWMVGVSSEPAGLFAPVTCARAGSVAASASRLAANVKRSGIELSIRIRQNLRRTVTCMLRIAFAAAGVPNSEGTVVEYVPVVGSTSGSVLYQLVYVT